MLAANRCIPYHRSPFVFLGAVVRIACFVVGLVGNILLAVVDILVVVGILLAGDKLVEGIAVVVGRRHSTAVRPFRRCRCVLLGN